MYIIYSCTYLEYMFLWLSLKTGRSPGGRTLKEAEATAPQTDAMESGSLW